MDVTWSDELNDDDYGSRRAERKARTRLDLRLAAHQLFADQGFESVTTAAIAATASVSVQTLFNHFASKEELFFDGRVPSVDGPAQAVRNRGPQEPALTALRIHLVDFVQDRVAFERTPEGRLYTSALAASPALSARERELVHEAEARLSCALAGQCPDQTSDHEVCTCLGSGDLAASLTAATWLGSVRVLIASTRRPQTVGQAPTIDLAALTDRVLRTLQDGVILPPSAAVASATC